MTLAGPTRSERRTCLRWLETRAQARPIAHAASKRIETDSEVDKEVLDGPSEDEQVREMVRHGISPECPECSTTLSYEEGCVKCYGCGYSEC